MLENSQLNVLIVDDEIFNVEVVIGFLEDEGYALSYTTDPKEALKMAFEKDYDLFLLDINMPNINGFELCKRLKNDEKTQAIPVMFLSAFNDIESITNAFSIGAVDYITKPFNGLELLARVGTHLKMRKYIHALKEKQDRLAQLATTDTLTGVPNRLSAMQILSSEISRVKSEPSRLCIAYIRIDSLSKINDIHGYKQGDKIIYKCAKIFEQQKPQNATFGRFFSSEFLLILPSLSLEAASVKVKHLYDSVKKLNITCSIGMCEYKSAQTADSFITTAQKIMESVKESGGDMIALKELSR